jgi:hypothetical protein
VQQASEGRSLKRFFDASFRFYGRPGSPGLPAAAQAVNSTRAGMRKLCWTITASIGLIVFCQAASAALDGRTMLAVGNSAYPNLSQRDDVELLAQGAGPPASTPPAATTPPPDSKGPQDPSPPAATSPTSPTETSEVTKPARTATGCALKFMAAEVSGKLKGRKWKEFREQECGESIMEAVFPTMIAPKYSGAAPDKARTLTCADQFNANKATNANGGLKWIEKSGGYYGECVSRLKG